MSRIVTLNDIEVIDAGKGTASGLLSLSTTAKTFRYLDEEELARQKKEKAAKDKAAQGAKK